MMIRVRWRGVVPWCVVASALVCQLPAAYGEVPHAITIDGNFDDWAAVPPRSDPAGAEMHGDVPDVHDTDQGELADVPARVSHPDVDSLSRPTQSRPTTPTLWRSVVRLGTPPEPRDHRAA